MEIMESNLLISVIGGLGRWESLEDGLQVYSKDDDCVGVAQSRHLHFRPSLSIICQKS
jgi:hypothetical protein